MVFSALQPVKETLSWHQNDCSLSSGTWPGMSQMFAGEGGGQGWRNLPCGVCAVPEDCSVGAELLVRWEPECCGGEQGDPQLAGQEGSPVPSAAAAAVRINQCTGVLELRKRLLCRKRCLVHGISPLERSCAGSMGTGRSHQGRNCPAMQKATVQDALWHCVLPRAIRTWLLRCRQLQHLGFQQQHLPSRAAVWVGCGS